MTLGSHAVTEWWAIDQGQAGARERPARDGQPCTKTATLVNSHSMLSPQRSHPQDYTAAAGQRSESESAAEDSVRALSCVASKAMTAGPERQSLQPPPRASPAAATGVAWWGRTRRRRPRATDPAPRRRQEPGLAHPSYDDWIPSPRDAGAARMIASESQRRLRQKVWARHSGAVLDAPT